jgi:arginase
MSRLVSPAERPRIQIIGVPIDLGASRRGTDGGPSALRIAGLGEQLQALGYQLAVE